LTGALAPYLAVAVLAGIVLPLWICLFLCLRQGRRLASLTSEREHLERLLREELSQLRAEIGRASRDSREEIGGAIGRFQMAQQDQAERMRLLMDEKLVRVQADARDGREEMSLGLKRFGEVQKEQLDSVGLLLKNQLETLAGTNEKSIERLRLTIEERLQALQHDNGQKLEQMRQTVDEKLHNTLEQRLGESFKLVSERLEQVHKGLGEMQSLASGVGDLKRVLTNVKTRGTWGEVQLDALLEQILTPEQYGKNVPTRPNGAERVEFAIRLPGRDSGDAPVWLPIDAKFPIEDYQKLLDAQDGADHAGIEASGKALEQRLKNEARTIRDKYVEPPHTTDFAILYLPIEGLYAEALRRPGLAETLQRDYRVTLAGPTTLAAMLNSLQMGFRTLAIERRSSEVWTLLGAVKTEFTKFGDALAYTRKKLEEATSSIDKAETRTRVLTRKLKEVEAIPAQEAGWLLPSTAEADD
jgi:DNA recombination protein RmuC